MRDQVASLTEHFVTAAMIGASLCEGEQIQRGDVSVVFGSPLEKRPPTVDSAITSLLLLQTIAKSLRRSVVSLFLLSVSIL